MSFLNGDHETVEQANPPVETESPTEELRRMVTGVVEAAIEREAAEVLSEAGGESLRSAPAWEIGPQRYGDPALWRPARAKLSLTEDESYRDLYEIVQEIGEPEV